MKKLLTVSLIAMMAVSAARADIASTGFVTDKTGDMTGYVASKTTLTGAVNDLDLRVTAVKGTADAAATKTELEALTTTVGTNKTAIEGTVSTLSSKVDDIDEAYKAADETLTGKFGDLGDQTVKAYVDTKTANIATSDTVTALGTRVTTAEGEIDTLQASLAEGGATATAIAEAKKAGDDAQADLDAYKESNGTALAGVKATAEAALPTADFNSFKTENTNAIATAKSEAIADAATDAASKYQDKDYLTSQSLTTGQDNTKYYTSVKYVEEKIAAANSNNAAASAAASAAAAAAQSTADSALAKAEANESAIDGLGALAGKSTIATADIDAKAVTLGKLADDVQASLGKADSAVQSVTTGTGNGNIDVDGTQVAVSGLKSAAFVETTAFDAAGTAATAKSEAIAAAKTETESQISALGLTDVSKVALPTACENGQATCALVYDSTNQTLKWEAIMK